MATDYKDLQGVWSITRDNEVFNGEFAIDDDEISFIFEGKTLQILHLGEIKKMKWGYYLEAFGEDDEKIVFKKYSYLEKVPLFSKIKPIPRAKTKMSLTKRIAFYGVFAGLAIIMAIIERMFPLPIPVPGIKLGLANAIVIMVLYIFNTRSAFSIAVLRIIIVGLLFGSVFGMAYSLAGGLVSFIVMVVAKRSNIFGVVGVSVFGGVAHNMAQIAVAVLLVNDIRLFWHSPFLIIAGVVTGILIGYTAGFAATNIKILKKI
ncbi:MAG: Gx transporter family protein [Defluviitaleaceae bacterium]|nr:Gx transporter family protein [Defluviitaleaceae bacterium]